MKKNFYSVLYFAVFFIASPALASQSNSDYTELQLLKKRLAILEEKIAEDEKSRAKSDDIFVTLKPAGALKLGGDKQSFAFDGRMQIDAGLPTKGKTSTNESSTALRRLWLGATGNIDKDWNYRFIVGFENNQTSIYDAFVKYQGFKNTEIFIGNIFENNGIDTASGNLATPLMERSSGITTFRQFRRTGVSVNPFGDSWGLHFGVFGNAPNNSTTSTINANNKGEGFSNRGHIDVINDKKNAQSLHLGFNNTYRWNSSGTNTVTGSNKTMRFNSTGDSNVLSLLLIDTGNIADVKNYYQNMSEIRYQNGSFVITSEYIKTTLNRSGAGNVNFNGGYLMASYFLTGEKYGYDSKQGIQTMPSIGSKGSWELAARYSTTDLNSKDINGGKLNSYNFGVNFYPNNNIKLMANYVFNRLNSSSQISQNPQYLMLRTQVSF